MTNATTRNCTHCHNDLPIKSFRTFKSKTGNINCKSYCKQCDNKLREKNRKINGENETRKEKRANGSQARSKIRYQKEVMSGLPTTPQRITWLKKYGLTIEDFESLEKQSNNRCYICGEEETRLVSKKLCVDHCHKTGKVRGLLCNRCNRTLGFLKDDIDLMLTMIGYIRHHQTESKPEPIFF